MLHEITPFVLDNQYRPLTPRPGDLVLKVNASGLWLRCGNEPLPFPICQEYPCGTAVRHLLTLDARPIFLCDDDTAMPQGDFIHTSVASLRTQHSQHIAFIAGVAHQIGTFYRTGRFCGSCGTAMRHSDIERAMLCSACGFVLYPRISPAVIVAITHGDRILLARGKNHAQGFYALVAGFVEAGESFEAAVRREVKEEVGIDVTDVRYFGDQPWPFSQSQMVGFFATADPCQPLKLQLAEIAEANWYTRGHLPPHPQGTISIAAALITAFENGQMK